MKRYILLFVLLWLIQDVYGQIPQYIEYNPWGIKSQEGIVSQDFADFNNDGLIDVVAAKNNGFYIQLRIKFNQGSNSSLGAVFTAPDRLFTYTDFPGNAYIKADDFDQDGDTDIIMIGNDGFKPGSIVRKLVNSSISSPTFAISPCTSIIAPFVIGVPSSIDINQDSLADLAVSNQLGVVDWYVNQGNFTFQKVATPTGLQDTFISQVAFDQLDLINRDELTTLSFNLELGFNIHNLPNYDIDTAQISTFIDPGIGTNYFYEMRFYDFNHNGNEDLFLVAYTSELGEQYRTNFYLISDVQECLKVKYLTAEDSPLVGVYRAQEQIVLQDTIHNSMLDSVRLSAPDLTLEGLLQVNDQQVVRTDPNGCVGRF